MARRQIREWEVWKAFRSRLRFADPWLAKLALHLPPGMLQLAMRLMKLVTRAPDFVRVWWWGTEIADTKVSQFLWFVSPLIFMVLTSAASFVVGLLGIHVIPISNSGSDQGALFASLVGALGSIFAIVFAIALVLLDIVERRYPDPSLLKLYLNHRSIVFFSGIFIWALITNLLVLANAGFLSPSVLSGAFLFGLLAILWLVVFLRITIKFLSPGELLAMLSRLAVNSWGSLR